MDRGKNVISLADESRWARPAGGRARRETKSGRDRSFPIHADLKAVLDKMPAAPGDDLIFHGPRGGRLKPDTLRGVLARDVLAPLAVRFPHPAGEPGFRDGRLHSFRHYFCSTCASARVAERVIMAWLGHADSAMVSRYYYLLDAESQRQMANMQFVGGDQSHRAVGG